MMWGLLSRIPGTRQHRAYTETVAFIADVERYMAENLSPGYPHYPAPLPRHPQACRWAIESMRAVLRSIKAGRDGGDAVAVLEEHFPVFS